jgi:formylglycine-generating enzyme required for sulfatase activity
MKLFVSYARVDKPLCKLIVERIENVHDVWYDRRLFTGQDWWDEIQERLKWCDGFVYLMSPESLKSEYCQKEYKIASDAGKYIFPVIIQARIPIPDDFSNIHCADVSEGMENLYVLMDALTVAERSIADGKAAPRTRSSTNNAISIPTEKPENLDVAGMIDEAAEAMDKADYDKAVYILKQAQTKNPSGARARMIEKLLKEAEADLERQTYLRMAAHEYLPIAATVKRERTRKLGCEEFAEFQITYPDYDPDNLAALCASAKAPSLRSGEGVGGEVKKESEVETRLRSFSGKKNADWQSYITTFPELKIPDMQFCLVPGGTFQMGSDDFDGAKPVHPQTVKPYWIARYPVTNAQWRAAVTVNAVAEPKGDSPLKWYNDNSMADAPVVGVSWLEAQKFCEWLGVRLPTEPEWEFAARGVDGLQYP